MEQDHVVQRLKNRLQHARRLGFTVRMEVLQDEQPGWCQIGSRRILFVDLSQTAAEQLTQLEETLASFSPPPVAALDSDKQAA